MGDKLFSFTETTAMREVDPKTLDSPSGLNMAEYLESFKNLKLSLEKHMGHVTWLILDVFVIENFSSHKK